MSEQPNQVTRFAKRVIAAVMRRVIPSPDRFLKKVKGVIHVGANSGQERMTYAKLGLNVAWIEPIPEVFKSLKSNIEGLPQQRAFQYLVTDKDGEKYDFHIATNEGASSSIFELDLHTELWPDISFTGTMQLQSVTLTSVVEKERLEISDFDALVMDTQGSELLVLRGAEKLIPHFKYIKTEVADFSVYRGCCVLSEIDAFLLPYGFTRVNTHRLHSKTGVGSCYDVVYRRRQR